MSIHRHSQLDLNQVEFRPLIVPKSLTDADAADFIAMVEIRNQIYREVSGHDDHAMEPARLLAHFGQDDPYEAHYGWVIVIDHRVVGRVCIDVPLVEGSRTLYWLVEIAAEAQGHGIGTRAYELVERTAAELGRTILQSWAQHVEAPGERVAAPTGFGSVPADDRAVRFFTRLGYTLEQIERCSVLDLRQPLSEAERLRAIAREASDGYRVVSWFAPTPPEFVAAGYGWLKSRMNTDAPSAGMVFDEEVWDEGRVALEDERATAGGGMTRVCAAQHIATGKLVAFSELHIGSDRSRASHQHDTLVLKEHRGHQLGTLIKAENLFGWRAEVPDSPRVLTFNAEENRPMLEINEALGFVPLSYEGAWKKALPQG